jgi:hypothetical protein
MKVRPSTLAGALLLAFVPGCGGGGGQGAVDLQPPTAFTAVQGGSFDQLALGWSEPTAQVDGYELEARIGGGAFTPLHTGLVPRGSIGAVIDLVTTVPELTQFTFRIRSALGGARSAWSPEVTYLRGIRPPSGLTATLTATPTIQLAWSNASAVADSLVVERADADAFGSATSAWMPLPVSFGATTFDDASLHELVHQAYRVRYGKGGVWSSDAATSAGPVPLFAPVGLTATLVTGGVRLGWANRSLVATRLTLTRWPSGTPVDLPVASTNALDPVSLPWPSTRYQLDASAPAAAGQTVASTWCALPAYQVDGPAGPLDALNPSIPDAMGLRRGSDGWFHWMGASGAGPTVVSQDAAGVAVHDLSFQVTVNPLLALDATDRPHAVGFMVPATGSRTLVHEWLGPAGWNSEVIAGYQGGGSTMVFAVDGLGRLHVLENLQHCVVSAGACAMAPVPQPAGWSSTGAASLLAGSDGTVAVITTGYGASATPMAVATRAPGGGWTVEVVPIDGGFNPEPRLVLGAGGDLGLLYHHTNPANPPGEMDARYVERRAGAWSAPEDLAPTQFTLYGAAAAPDLSRVVAFTRPGSVLGSDLVLWSRGPAGWTGSLLGHGSNGMTLLGVLATGKAWLLTQPSAGYPFPLDPTRPWSLWEER